MRKMWRLIIPVLVVAGLTACASNTDGEAAPSSATHSSAAATVSSSVVPPAIPADTLSTPEISPEQRRAAAASLLMPAVVSFDDALAKLTAGVGGIFIPSWADPELINTPGRDIWALRKAVNRPFDVAIDFEGGRVQRFSEILGGYPAAQVMAQGTSAEVEETAFNIGRTLAARGITVDFAPVLDVGGADLSVVGDRSFSADPNRVGELGVAFAHGLQRAGIKPVFKHYPGHGRASADTHYSPAVTPPLEELYKSDLIPYSIALPLVTGPGVMMGHMVVPGLGDGHTPSSLNPAAYDLLRHHHDFQGITYTDDLTGMKAITADFTPERAVVAALAAGADQALWSTNVDINFIIDSVVAAVEDGQISPERFATAVERVHNRLGA